MKKKNEVMLPAEAGGKKKKKVLILVIVIIAALLVIGLLGVKGLKPGGKEGSEQLAPVTDQVIRTTLTSSISATGTLKSKEVTDISVGNISELGVKVTDVSVQVGDRVEKGDLLCSLDVSDAQADLDAAKKARQKARDALAREKSAAKKSYDKSLSAKKSLLSDAQSEIDRAKNELNQAKAAKKAIGPQIEAAKKAVDQAKKKLDAASGEDAIAKAQIDLQNARDELAGLKEGKATLEEAVSAAQAAYDAAKSAYKSAASEADDAIEAARDAMNAVADTDGEDDAALDSQIRALEQMVESASIKAPVSGTVTAVNLTKDAYYTGGTAVTIQDTENLYVLANIKEIDIPDVEKGMRVLIKTDATGDEELEGKVVSVSPTSGSGSVDPSGLGGDLGYDTGASAGTGYLIKIDLLTKNERLRVDMTAKLALIKQQHANILAVPFDAIFEDENGNKTLHVQKDAGGDQDTQGEASYEEIPIETGMESGYYVEVMPAEGIKEGTTILMPQAGEGMVEMDPASGL